MISFPPGHTAAVLRLNRTETSLPLRYAPGEGQPKCCPYATRRQQAPRQEKEQSQAQAQNPECASPSMQPDPHDASAQQRHEPISS